MYYYGYVALITFGTSALCKSLIMFLFDNNYKFTCYDIGIYTTLYIILCSFSKLFLRSPTYKILLRAFFLGQTFQIGISLYLTALESWKFFGIYVAVLSTFHLTEYLAIAFTNPKVLSSDTFVINHSLAYTLAAITSWIEFLIERYYISGMKENKWILLIGLSLCFIGEIFRKTAIFTAKHNFNHIVQSKKKNDHELITHGVYSICRHPSYVGWFYWSIGTQLILQNPICLIAYSFASWNFFNDRILHEELSLIEFFGNSYIQYQEKVCTGLPFISGYKIPKYD